MRNLNSLELQRQRLVDRIKKQEYLSLVKGDEGEISIGNGKAKNFQSDPEFRRLAQADLESMVSKVDLALEPDIWRILLVQSVVGHAQNGHCLFAEGENYKLATISDVIAAAGLNVQATKERRQGLINDVYQWVERAFDNKANRLVLNNKPLLGANFLRNYHVDIESTLKGMVLAGFMDNYQARADTVSHYETTISGRPLVIGGGETFLINAKRLAQTGIDYDFLATHEHNEKALDLLRDLGVIVKKRGRQRRIKSAYIRRMEGAGTSDDLAFIMVGKLYGREDIEAGTSAMLGAFVVDAVDTYDKCVLHPINGGFDEALGQYIQDEWQARHGEPLVKHEDIMRVIYYAAKLNDPKTRVSSSHRYLVQHINEVPKPTIINHIEHHRGNSVPKYPVGFARKPSTTLYRNANVRARHMLEELAA
jgi:hypothetical protein